MKVKACASYFTVTAILFNSTEIQPEWKNLQQLPYWKFVWFSQCIIWWQLLRWNRLIKQSMKLISLFMWEKQVDDKSNVSSILLVIRLCTYFVQLLHIVTGWVIINLSKGSTQNQPKYKHLNQGVAFGCKSQVQCPAYPTVCVVFLVPYLLGFFRWNHW